MSRSQSVCRLALVLIGCAALIPGLRAQPQEVYPVRTAPFAQSLNGQWQFRYLPGPDQGADEILRAAEASQWPAITVPGHWELQGFAEPKYGKELAAGTGLYRRTFRVPAGWQGQRIFLHFEGVLYGFDAWVNGTKVGSWASAYNPVAFDVTDALKPGADNLLAVRVTTRSHGWEFDVNDCWALSGIYRDVTLFAVPAAHFEDFNARTRLNSDGSANLTFTTRTSEPAAVNGRLLAPDGKFVCILPFSTEENVARAASVKLDRPQLWTAETPALYTVELELSSGQRLEEKIGLRDVTVADGVLRLNGVAVKLRGADHHDLWPDTGRVATEELMRRDLELMRAANINFIRTSHYPPHPRFLELCDELGFYVMDEVPFGFGEEHLTDPAYQDSLLTRAEATVRRDQNHASIIVWSVGNENPNTPLTFATGRRVKELDPTRPVCFPQIGTYFATSYPELPDWVDIYAPHYPGTDTVRDYAGKLTRPVIFTEYAHALGLASDQIQAQWAIMQASPRIAGGAIWMFQDQGIRRTAEANQNPGISHNLGLAVWPDAGHYFDTAGNLGMDGIVYSDRTPQADYWQVRKVYSPVQIAGQRVGVQPGANQLSLSVENRFDFRSLEGIALNWSLQRNGAPIQQGSAALRAAAQTTEKVAVAVTLPADAGGDIFTLALSCTEGAAASFYERTLRLDAQPPGTPLMAALTAHWPAAVPGLDERPQEIRITSDRFVLTVGRPAGEITLSDRTGRVLVEGILPHAGRRFTEGELMRAKKELTWSGAVLPAAAPPGISVARTLYGIEVRIRGRYARSDAPGQALEGEMRLLARTSGVIDVEYDYVPAGDKGLLLEAGVALVAPATATELRWVGAGPYAGYPGKDALNEFGAFHLNRTDLRFQGNRRATELALLTDPAGGGVALGGLEMDVAVENLGEKTIFSHNAVLSGRGTKFATPDAAVTAEAVGHIAGHFTLLALDPEWPAQLSAWFGPADLPAAEVMQPFYHSYDQ